MKTVPLVNSDLCAIVDDADYQLVRKYNWYLLKGNTTNYAKTGSHTYMHRVISGAPRGMDTDHWNHDGLDNRRQNLRICTKSENHRNKNRHRDSRSPYLGVSKRKNANRWESAIMVNRKRLYLGLYKTAEEAARARDAATLKYYGDRSPLNFPSPDAKEKAA